MGERDTGSRQGSPGEDNGRAEAAKSFFASVVCVVGIVLALGAAISTVVSGGSYGVVSAGVVGVGLGVLGYFLGSNRLGTATIVISIVALFFGLAASQGIIPGLEGDDRSLPAEEPGS